MTEIDFCWIGFGNFSRASRGRPGGWAGEGFAQGGGPGGSKKLFLDSNNLKSNPFWLLRFAQKGHIRYLVCSFALVGRDAFTSEASITTTLQRVASLIPYDPCSRASTSHWFSMNFIDLNELYWFSIDCNDFQWLSLDFNDLQGFHWMSMIFLNFPWCKWFSIVIIDTQIFNDSNDFRWF